MNLDHINIAAPMDLLEKVRDFYCDVLGLEVGDRPAFSGRGFWLYSGERALVHLSEATSRQPPKKSGYLDHVAFRARDAERVESLLRSRGIDYRRTSVPGQAVVQLFLNDPAGIKLEINFRE
jgi:catechol 2,3-dioxygenase-like lactoylglutathione lyase family enzyme